MAKKWTEEEIDFLKNNYENMTYREISKHINRTISSIELKSSRLGLKKSKYEYDHSFFKEINNEEKAYWLGFIYADGYISYNEEISNYELGIELQTQDADHLRNFNKALKGNVPVNFRERFCKLTGKLSNNCSIRFYSKEMVFDLERQGVLCRKSLILKELPKLSKELLPHFIRGYFDGNGCICYDKKQNNIRADFACGSIDFLKDIQRVLYEQGIYSYFYIPKKEEAKYSFRLLIKGMRNTNNFFNYIYKDCNIYLPRKKNKKDRLYQDCKIRERLPRQQVIVD